MSVYICFWQVYVAGASIPYPVNYIINFSVVLAFFIVLLTIASYRYHKMQAARAYRQSLTGRQCLNLNMEGVQGQYPPKKIKRLLKLKEMRLQREAEAAEKEYEIRATAARDRIGSQMQEQPELKVDEKPSEALPDQRKQSAAKAPVTVQDEPRIPDIKTSSSADEISTTQEVVDAPETLPADGGLIPAVILPDEQNVDIAVEDASAANEGNAEMPNERSVGQSQNNAAERQNKQHTDQLPEVTSATKATQTYGPQAAEQTASSSTIGSFDDSVTSF